jgi:hypothetical protein
MVTAPCNYTCMGIKTTGTFFVYNEQYLPVIKKNASHKLFFFFHKHVILSQTLR